jgi:hypothetical protein
MVSTANSAYIDATPTLEFMSSGIYAQAVVTINLNIRKMRELAGLSYRELIKCLWLTFEWYLCTASLLGFLVLGVL